MEITITATEANRKFSEILRGVRKGNRYTITNRGEPVAFVAGRPEPTPAEIARKRRSLAKFLKELQSRPVLNLPRFTREEMHER